MNIRWMQWRVFFLLLAFTLTMNCGSEDPVVPTKDTTPPSIVTTTPTNGTIGVLLLPAITVTFSEQVEASTVKTTTFLMSGGVTGTVDYSNRVATFTPDAELDSSTVYTATLTTGIADLAGNSLANDFSWSFTTITSGQNQPPVAVAGDDQDINIGSIVELDGTGSSDPEDATLTYRWTQVLGPDVTGGQGYLLSVDPSFTAPPLVTTIQFDLVVNDGIKDSPADRIQINIMEDKTHAVFVAPNGSDSDAGTRAAPVQTIQTALTRAVSAGADVYLSGGTYQVNTTIALLEGISMYGGFRRSDWARDGVATTVIDARASVGLSADAISNATIIDGITVQSQDSPTQGGTSYGVRVNNSFGLVLRGCTIEAGAGGAGQDGTPFAGPAAAGGNGGLGGPGCENSSGLCSSCSRPIGGHGGLSDIGRPGGDGGRPGNGTAPGDNGFDGSGGAAGGLGTPAGRGDWNPTATYLGNVGANGQNGPNGGAASEGSYAINGYLPGDATSGSIGTHGHSGSGGGGGGGGSSSCDSYGGGGGGGGAAGEAGAGGPGGGSGGGSFAVYLWGSDILIENCVLVTGDGGSGGNGAAGQTGGAGGIGGHVDLTNKGNNYGGSGEQDDGSNGGRGGDGGRGGNGGAGGGGAGGPAIGVLLGNGSNPTLTGVTYTLGSAGAGGSSPGNAGPSGRRSNTYRP